MTTTCASPLSFDELIAYVVGELDEPREQDLEAHVFECEHCGARWAACSELGRDVRQAFGEGLLALPVTQAVLYRAASQGLRLREYTVTPGGTAHCTAAPDDDLVIIRLDAGFAPGEAVDVDVEQQPQDGGIPTHTSSFDLPFEGDTGQLVFANPASVVRGYANSRWTITAHAHDPETGRHRTVGPFILHHARWGGSTSDQ